MKEGALKWGLRLLSISLMIGPLIAAFAVHNWDVKEAVMGGTDMEEIGKSVESIIGKVSENMFVVGSPTTSGNTIRIPIQFTSPAKFTITIKEITATVSDQGTEIGQVHLEEDEVEVPARGTVNFTLVGTYSGVPPTHPQLSEVEITLEAYGVTIQAQISGGKGGP